MSSLIEHLTALPPLRTLSPAELGASARYWVRRDLAPGEQWRVQGEQAEGLAFILGGTLVASVDGLELAALGPGEIVGEVSALLADARASASLEARGPVTLAALSRRSLLGLRRAESPVYDALLQAALGTLAARIRQTDERIDLSRVRTTPPEAVEPRLPSEQPPPAEPLLRGLPGLRGAPASVLGPLVGALESTAMQAGQVLTEEGTPGDAAWVVAEGLVRVDRGPQPLVELSRLGPGDPFGFNALLDDGPRSARCTCVQGGWLWRMRREAYRALPAPSLRAWREALLATLAAQLRIANQAVAPGADASFRPLLLAAGALQGISSAELEESEQPIAALDPLRDLG